MQELAAEVVRLTDEDNNFSFIYDTDESIESKIEKISRTVYGADGVEYTDLAKEKIETFIKNGWDKLPVCMAKTQYSFSDNKDLLGAPEGFTVTIKSVKVSAGAGFVVALTGDIMTMPGLPKIPAAENIDVDENGEIVGLF
jgi:formate--tetrahydrofolate ligase